MKKQIIYTLGLGLGLMLTGCSDDFTNWANPMSNAEEDAKTVKMEISPAAAINLATVTTDSVQLFIPAITASELGTNSYEVVASNVDATASGNIIAGENGMVATSELASLVSSLYGSRPEERTLNLNVSAYTTVNGQAIKNQGTTTAAVTPAAPEIESAYYITGGINSWDNTDKTYELKNGGGDVYDDPVFTITLTADQVGDGFEFKLTPLSGVGGDWTKCITADADNTEGKIAGNNAGGNLYVGKVEGAKFYVLSFNMLDQTWSIKTLSFGTYFYEIGNDSGWSTSNALYGANADGKYQGYYYLDGEFKFKPNADNWDDDYEYDGEGKIADNGGNNCPAPDPSGFYQIDVDLVAGTYKLTQVTSISIIGELNSWNGDIDLTYNRTSGAWEASNVALYGEFKFRMNHDWTTSWGGDSFDNLTSNNGANLEVERGTYDVKLYISHEGNNKVVFTQK